MDKPTPASASSNIGQPNAQRAGTSGEQAAQVPAGRRDFLKVAAALGAAAAAAAAVGTASYQAGEPEEKKTRRRLAMVIDLRRCTGCRACAVACKAEHNVPLGSFRSHVGQVEVEHGGNFKRYFIPRLCNHCENPACTKVCPVGATYKRREDGAVLVNKQRCLGCRYCVVACPYAARFFQWHRQHSAGQQNGPTGGYDAVGPWPARKYGVVDKCDFCQQRIDQGLEPACVNTCPARARIFGDLHDPESEVSRLVAMQPAGTLAPELGTRPSVFYLDMHEGAARRSVEVGLRLNPVSLNPTLQG